MKTLIVSVFPGCGKTYLTNKFKEKYNNYSIIDKDSGILSCQDDYVKYSDKICDLVGKVNIVLISQHPEVLEILYSKGYKYIIVAPNNSPCISNKSRMLIKQQWFGRFILRQNTPEWIELLYNNYDQWTTWEHLRKMKPERILLLGKDEYLTDVIDDIVDLISSP